MRGGGRGGIAFSIANEPKRWSDGERSVSFGENQTHILEYEKPEREGQKERVGNEQAQIRTSVLSPVP